MVHIDKTTAYVHQAVMLGWSRAHVDDYARAQDPPLSRADIDAAYAACVEHWLTEANTDDSQLYALHVARREELYRRAMKDGDLALAHKVLVDQAKLQRQYKIEQTRAARQDQETALAERLRQRGQPKLSAVRPR